MLKYFHIYFKSFKDVFNHTKTSRLAFAVLSRAIKRLAEVLKPANYGSQTADSQKDGTPAAAVSKATALSSPQLSARGSGAPPEKGLLAQLAWVEGAAGQRCPQDR